jgi:uncharacterized membrane protein YozB (DUF420 family)
MSTALWIFGILAIVMWALTALIVCFPPGDKNDARALGEMLAAVPCLVAIFASLVWVFLAAAHWL